MITLRGRYTLIGSKQGKLAEFDNLITDAGLNQIGTGGWLNSVHIGTGTTEPSVLDTSLDQYQAGATDKIAENTINAGQAPWKKRYYVTYRFAAATDLDENLEYSEIGAGWGANNLFSRALILDVNGEPTTITVLDDEYLDVIYALEISISSLSAAYEFTYNGLTYAGTIKAAGATSNNVVPADACEIVSGNAHDGILGGIGGFPAGNAQALTVGNDAYVDLSLEATGRARVVNSTLSTIKSLSWTYGGLGVSYQADFTDEITDALGFTVALNVALTWSRA